MTTPKDKDLLTQAGWPGGINNRARETENVNIDNRMRIPAGQFLRSALNVDLTSKGTPLRRRGYSQVTAGYMHSMWRSGDVPFALVVNGGQLSSIAGDELAITPLMAVDVTRQMSYATVNDKVFFSNGLDRGCVDFDGILHPWGIDVPGAPGLTATTALGLNAGQYQVAVTHTIASGEESGASEPSTIDVAQGAGIIVALPPSPIGATTVNVYVTQANGEVFMLHTSLPAGTSTVTVGLANVGTGRLLETQHMEPPIPADIVRHYNGRIYFAVGAAVFFTEALRYGLVRYSQNMYMMPGDVTLLEPSEDGLYIGYGDTVVFISGENPYDTKQDRVDSHGPVMHTGTRVPGKFLDRELEYVPVWWTKNGGMIAGLPGGEATRLTEDRLDVPGFGAGAILAREREGMRHLVSALRQPGEDSFSATDSVVAEIRRNAVKT